MWWCSRWVWRPGIISVVLLLGGLSLLTAMPLRGESLTSGPEWSMLLKSLEGIEKSLKGVSEPLENVSQYFEAEKTALQAERTTLDEDRRLFEMDKQAYETQKNTLEERGRLYDYLNKENEGLRDALDEAYSRGIRWALLCGGVGFVVGVLVGGLLF